MRVSRKGVFAAFLAVAVTVLGGLRTARAQAFQHPGVMLSRAQLDYMKAMVNAHQEPFYSAFVKAQNSKWGSLTYAPYGPPSDGFIKCGSTSNPDIGCKNSDDDSSAAYVQSLLWYITGNQAYANNAITILNLYGHNLKGYSTQSPYSNAPLQAAWDGEKWPRSAEIIRYSNAGWADADIQAFGNMLTTAILPRIIKGSTSNGNWEISMIEAMIGIGVFNNDAATFNTGVTFWRQRIPSYFYYHTDGAQPVPAPRGKANWYGQTVYDASVDGISQETCRDFGHAQYGLAGALNAAETAHIQGIDLYTDSASNAQNRLTAALEFNANYLLGNPVPASVCGGTVKLQTYPTDEIGYNEYHNRLGINLPLTLQYLQDVIRQLPDPTENHMMVYESLTHGGDASMLGPFLLRTPSSFATVRAGGTATYTINVIPGSDPNPDVAFNVSGLPPGATPSFSPSTVTGTGATTLTITTTSSTPAGSYTLTLTGSSGTANYPLTLNLIVNSQSADFSIRVSPLLVTAVAGDLPTFTMAFTPVSGYLGNVALSVSNGLPAGATATFSSTMVSSASPTSTLTLLIAGTTAPGSYPLTVSATDGSTTHTTIALLIVNTISSACIQQLGNNWISGTIPAQTGTFTAEWDATPSTSLNNSNVGLSLGPQAAFTGLAISGRFNPVGIIDARNGGVFAADNNIPFTAGKKYHFRAVVNIPANTYSIYVTPEGQSEITIGLNYAFRSEQAGITSIDHWDAISQVGTIALCNLVIDVPDFSITTPLSSRTVAAGNAVTYAATVAPIAGYSGSVSFNATGLPSGATAAFSPATVSSPAYTTALKITTAPSLAQGTYPFTITATDGTITHNTYLALVVTSPCQTPVASSQNVSTQNGTANITLAGAVGATCSASDPLAYAIVNNPAHGVLSGTAPNLVYTPAAGYTGIDSFTFTVSDSAAIPATSGAAMVYVSVQPVTAVQLVTTAALSQLGDGSYQAIVMVKNGGSGTAHSVVLTGATLGSAAGSPVPAALGDIPPGASAVVTIHYPSSAGAPGAAAAERYTGTYTGGTFGGSIRAILPGSK